MLTRKVNGRVYNFEFCLGRGAMGGNGFANPMDFALGSDDSLYVVSRADEYNKGRGLTKCTLNHEFIWDTRGPGFGTGTHVNFGTGIDSNFGDSPYYAPVPALSVWLTSIDLDDDENSYVSDEYVGAIFIHDKDGTPLGRWGTKGSGDGELNGPSGLAFNKEDDLYIVDSLNHRVQKFTKDGRFLLNWGKYGTDIGEFNMPWGITIDKNGDLYVADWRNDRVQKFSPEGDHLATFGSSGTGDGELQRPTGVAIDEEGDVYVTDNRNNRLNIYDAEGNFVTAFVGDAIDLSPWAQAGLDVNVDAKKARRMFDVSRERHFQRPVAVNVDDKGRIIVLETKPNRIQIYVKERNWVDPPFNL